MPSLIPEISYLRTGMQLNAWAICIAAFDTLKRVLSLG